MKSTATILAAAMFVWDRMMASPSLAGAAAVDRTMHMCAVLGWVSVDKICTNVRRVVKVLLNR